jgi:hypothetical protein
MHTEKAEKRGSLRHRAVPVPNEPIVFVSARQHWTSAASGLAILTEALGQFILIKGSLRSGLGSNYEAVRVCRRPASACIGVPRFASHGNPARTNSLGAVTAGLSTRACAARRKDLV